MISKAVTNSNTDFEQILSLITEARKRVYVKANAELVMLYFNVGKFVTSKIEQGVWGDGTVNELASFIQSKMPNLSGFNRRGLYRMKQFYETYNPNSDVFKLWQNIQTQKVSPTATQVKNTDNQLNTNVSALPSHLINLPLQEVSALPTQLEKIDNQQNINVSQLGTQTPITNVSELRTQNNDIEVQHTAFINKVLLKISWSNHRLILSKTKSAEEKIFYITNSIIEKYSSTELERQLNTATFERTIMSNQIVAKVQTQLPQGIFKDPYIFEFLNLPDAHSEFDLEKAITLNLQKFILEIGKGFTYMGNQYRLQVGNKDYYTDLLFYHRDLQCLVLFELKIEDFAPEFIGKLNFYLEALDRDVKLPNENPSIGILLCKGKDVEVVEYAMARNISPAIIAEYETKLIDRKLLAEKLHQLSEILNKEK